VVLLGGAIVASLMRPLPASPEHPSHAPPPAPPATPAA
jgi:hypothetical protein